MNKLLSKEEVREFQKELDQLQVEIRSKLGQEDRDYIEQIHKISRYMEISGRLLIHFSLDPITWGLGVTCLGLYNILENMEIGHNVMHGQYDFLNDPRFDSKTYEWDTASVSKDWRKSHNFMHHTYTNVVGRDHDVSYDSLRMTPEVEWKPSHLLQPLSFVNIVTFFDYSIALYTTELSQLPKNAVPTNNPKKSREELLQDTKLFVKKFMKRGFKNYVFYPALAGPLAPKVALGNFSAGIMRNIWSAAVIMCGHFSDDVQMFTEEEIKGETKGDWYLRQLLGSGNFTGNRLIHILSGHLSYQIEHHLFPNIPAWRYREMAPRVEAVCEKFGVPYNTGSFFKQVSGSIKRVFKYSLPNPKVKAPAVRNEQYQPVAAAA